MVQDSFIEQSYSSHTEIKNPGRIFEVRQLENTYREILNI